MTALPLSALKTSLVAAALLFSAPVFADPGDDPLDDLDDILNPSEDRERSVGDERRMLEKEAESDGASDEDDLGPSKRRVIKTLQKKNVMKINRWEFNPYGGFLTNDPFINRYIIGSGVTYHVTEVFGVEVTGTFAPDFGQGDWKGVTKQIVNENQVTPDISKVVWYGTASFTFSPIYGKVALAGRKIINFDIYGVFGTGVTGTKDDLEALGKTDEPEAVATESQLHPTLNFGGGLRVIFNPTFAMRVEARGMSYIEVLESTQLEMKNNVFLQVGGSIFFPGMK